ncbi:uncharacterized protein F54H12.2-like [Heteronotia binoei]|uniref:uncharacterized protein F54H12.2-like n=1 Tax=Heteronotia binoei TaxID=13085 RepID=UPI00292D710D|nr:uncharacterized protein F54H12.2-like [Heteronotia binoei]
MSFIHCGSEVCVKSELDLFQIAPTQTCIEKSLYIEVPPLSALMGSTHLEFYIAGNGEDYIDLNNTLLYVKCKITQEDGTDLPADTRVALVNYPIASIFSQLDVTIGDRLISQSNNCYPYRTMIETLLNYSGENLATQFSARGFYKDTAGQHDSTILTIPVNKGFSKRAELTAESRVIDLLGHLHADLFFQEKLLLNGVDVKIKLTRSRDTFCLMSSAGDTTCFKLQLDSASLFVKKVRVSPGVQLAHAEALMTSTAKYPVDCVSTKVFSISAGARVSNQDNLFLGQLPKMVVMALVDNDAFSGGFTKNPFHFKDYNINFAALYVDGEQIPPKPFQPDFAAGNVREYMSLVQTVGKHLQDRPLLIDRDEYQNGYTLFAFDLSPDQECADHYFLIKTGNLRAEIRFADALPQTVNFIMYGVFDSVIEINQNPNVLFDYM